MLETTAKIGIHATNNPLVATIGSVLPISKGKFHHQLILEKQRYALTRLYYDETGMQHEAVVTLDIDFKNNKFDVLSENGAFKPDEKFYFNNVAPVSGRAAQLEAVSILITEAIRVGSRIMEFYYQSKKSENEA